MAFAITHLLSNGSGTDATTYTTGTVSVTAGDLLVIVYTNAVGTGPAPTVSAITGTLGSTLTCTSRVTTLSNSTQVSRTTIFTAPVSSTASGTFTFAQDGTTQASAQWTFVAVTGHNATTPFIRSQAMAYTGATTTMTLSPAPASDSAVIAAGNTNSTTQQTAGGTGYTAIGNGTGASSPSVIHAVEYDLTAPSATVGFTHTGTLNRCMCAIEIAPGGPAFSDTANLSGSGTLTLPTCTPALPGSAAPSGAGTLAGAQQSIGVVNSVAYSGAGTLGITGSLGVKLAATIPADLTNSDWTRTGTASATSTRLTMPANSTSFTVSAYSADESRVFWKLTQLGSVGYVRGGFQVDTSNYIGITVSQTTLICQYIVAGSPSYQPNFTWDAAKPFLSIREAGGTVYFERSATGQAGTWETLHSSTTMPTYLLSGQKFGFWTGPSNTGDYWIENVNTPGSAQVAFSGSGTLTNPTRVPAIIQAVPLGGNGTLSVPPVRITVSGSATLTGDGTLSAPVIVVGFKSNLALSGLGELEIQRWLVRDLTILVAEAYGAGLKVGEPEGFELLVGKVREYVLDLGEPLASSLEVSSASGHTLRVEEFNEDPA